MTTCIQPNSADRIRGTIRLAHRVAAASILTVLPCQLLASAERLAVQLTAVVPAVDQNLVNGTDGFEFIPVFPMEVTDLRWYDHDGDGLIHAHQVGIFETESRTLLASATIDNGDPLDPETNFRFEVLAEPLLLSAGVSYTISGNGSGPAFDHYLRPLGIAESVAIDPMLDFVGYRSKAITGGETEPVFPVWIRFSGQPDQIWLGANFSFRPVSDQPYYGVVKHHRTPAAAVTFSLPQPVPAYPPVNYIKLNGFEVIPRTPVWVAELGFFDFGGNGLAASHPVGIYDSLTKELLASVTVSSSTIRDPKSNFRYVKLPTPLKLDAGRSYSIVGYGPANATGNLLVDLMPKPQDATLDPNFFYCAIKYEWDATGLTYPSYSDVGENSATDNDRLFNRGLQSVNFRFLTVHPDTPEITSIAVDRDNRTVDLTWTSRAGLTYAIERSTNLSDWEEIATDLPGGEVSSEFRDEFLKPLPEHLSFRVRLLE